MRRSDRIGAVVGIMVIGFMMPMLALARPNKVDVCHKKRNGNYYLMNISASRWQAHLDHGDAAPGDAVPDAPDSVFDSECNLVLLPPTVVCPCGFSEDNFFALGGDPDTGCFSMVLDAFTAILDSQVSPTEIMRVDRSLEFCFAGVVFEPSLLEEELDQCESDIDALISKQSLPACSP